MYRVLYSDIIERCIEVIREICSSNGNVSSDHVHVLVPPRFSVSKVVQYIKGKSSRRLQELRERYWGQHLCARGYFVATSGQIGIKGVQGYIEEQETHHKDDTFKISEF